MFASNSEVHGLFGVNSWLTELQVIQGHSPFKQLVQRYGFDLNCAYGWQLNELYSFRVTEENDQSSDGVVLARRTLVLDKIITGPPNGIPIKMKDRNVFAEILSSHVFE